MTTIRRAKKSDTPFVKQVYRECRTELGSFDLFNCWQKFIEGYSKEIFNVVPNGGVIRWGYSRKYKSFIVHDIGVLKAARGKGIGKELLSTVPLPFILKCNADNVGGNAFYKALGLQLRGKTTTKKGREQNIYLCVEL